MKKFSLLIVLAAGFVFSGCATQSLDANRNPSSVKYADASADGEASAAAYAFQSASTDRCIARVRAACTLSNNDVDRIADNVKECKQLTGGGSTQELFLLTNGKIVVITTAGSGRCERAKYWLGSSIEDMLIVKNGQPTAKAWLRTSTGALYFVNPSEKVFEFENSSGNSYSGVRDLSGVNDGSGDVILSFSGGSPFRITDEVFARRGRNRVGFSSVPTNRSLFRDE